MASNLKEHIKRILGEEEADYFTKDFVTPTQNKSQKFLNADADVSTFYYTQDSVFVYAVHAQIKNDARIADLFPKMKPDEEHLQAWENFENGVTKENPEASLLSFKNSYKVLIDTNLEKDSDWLYIFFSNTDKVINSNLLNLLKEDLKNFNSSDKFWNHLEEELINKPKPIKEIGNGALYFMGETSIWPLGILNDTEIDFFGGKSIFNILTALWGKVHFPVFFPEFQLHLPLGSIDLGEGTKAIGSLDLAIVTPAYYTASDINLSLNGQLNFDNKLEIDISGKWPLYSNYFEIDASCKIHEIPFFDHAAFPGLATHPPDLDLDVKFYFSKLSVSLLAISFSASIQQLVLVENALTITHADLDITISNPIYRPVINAKVSAQTAIGSGGTLLNTRGSLPYGELHFDLDPSTPISIAELVAALFGNSAGIPQSLEISEFAGDFSYHDKSMQLSVGISDNHSWEIIEGLSFVDLHLFVRKADSLSAQLSGHLKFGGTIAEPPNFEFNASYGDGWSVSASYVKSDNGITMSKLAKTFGFNSPNLPDFINNISIDEVDLSFVTTNSEDEENKVDKGIDKQFKIAGSDTIRNGKPSTKPDDAKIKFELILDVEASGNSTFAGHMVINEAYVFDIIQQKSSTGNIMLAAYHQENDKDQVDISKILKGLGVETQLPPLNISLQDALYASVGSSKLNLFLADVGASMNLSNLPLIGKMLPQGKGLVMSLRVIYGNNSRKPKDVEKINEVLPDGINPLIVPEKTEPEGLKFVCELKVGGESFSLDLKPNLTEPNLGSDDPQITAVDYTPPVPGNANIEWVKIGKKFGPVFFNRIGVAFEGQEVSVYPDVTFTMGALSFSLDGLSVSSPITEFKPIFHLDGIGLDYNKPPIEIGASFLRRKVQINGKEVDEYDGMAIIKTSKLSISALGSYAYINGNPSLFIYAYLNQALGGPSFFFVEGLAAGFGYNRSLIMPTIDKVSTFPLVRQVMETSPPDANLSRAEMLTQQLDLLSKYIPPSAGQMFFAIGIKFNSFKLIDSFVLLAVSFGKHFELDILGQSNIVVPSELPAGQEPLAEIKIQLIAKYDPDEGILQVMALITNDSYILSKDCHLSGGAAFYSWFKGEHSGDFVVTMGGYHPAFDVPSHYPKVPRLALNWEISSTMSVKGDMYFALCPHAFMAGGHLEALYHDGALKAWFKLGADFLITWQPYHYDASMYVDIGASYTYHFFGTHHITVDLGADVHIWGPEFAGEATIHIWIISIDVAFGNQGSKTATPIGWNKFKTACIPAENDMVAASILQGQHGEDENKKPIVNPRELEFVIDSAFPLTAINAHCVEQDPNNATKFISKVIDIKDMKTGKADFPQLKETGFVYNPFGIAPMNKSGVRKSTLDIVIKKDSNKNGMKIIPLDEMHFVFEPQIKNLPNAIWGKNFRTGLNDEDKTSPLVTGVKISSKDPNKHPKIGILYPTKSELVDNTLQAVELKEGLTLKKDPSTITVENINNYNQLKDALGLKSIHSISY